MLLPPFTEMRETASHTVSENDTSTSNGSKKIVTANFFFYFRIQSGTCQSAIISMSYAGNSTLTVFDFDAMCQVTGVP